MCVERYHTVWFLLCNVVSCFGFGMEWLHHMTSPFVFKSREHNQVSLLASTSQNGMPNQLVRLSRFFSFSTVFFRPLKNKINPIWFSNFATMPFFFGRPALLVRRGIRRSTGRRCSRGTCCFRFSLHGAVGASRYSLTERWRRARF